MINKFLSTHGEDFGIQPERALYICDGNNTTYIFEAREYKDRKKTFMFRYSMGYLTECRTEVNTFDMYFALVPMALHAEYITF